MYFYTHKIFFGEFPGGPGTSAFTVMGPSSIPAQGTKILQAKQCGQIYNLFMYVYIHIFFFLRGASLVAQPVKNPSAMRETWIPSLGWEDPLVKGKAAFSGMLAWRKNSMDCIVHGVAKSQTQLSNFHFHLYLYT